MSQENSIIKKNTQSAQQEIEKNHITILTQAKKEIEALLSKKPVKQSAEAKKKKPL